LNSSWDNMTYKETYNNLEQVENEIKFLAKSEIRLQILNSLIDSPKSIKEIVNKTKLTYSSVSSNINKLAKKDHIYKVKSKYHISHISNVYFKNLLDFNKLIKIIKNYEKFWNKHQINNFSSESLQSITVLNNAELIESTPIDIYRPHNYMKNLIKDSNEIKAIFPYLHPDYPQMLEYLLEKNAKIEIIIPKSIESPLLENINRKLIKKGIKNKNLKIKTIKEDLNLSLMISNNKMSLGLFKSDKTYDQNRLLISNDKKAIKWALDLFNNFNNNTTTNKKEIL